jgi:hypothetical protein
MEDAVDIALFDPTDGLVNGHSGGCEGIVGEQFQTLSLASGCLHGDILFSGIGNVLGEATEMNDFSL